MKNCEMILAGFGGQGILFTGKILAFAAMLKDKMTFSRTATLVFPPRPR